MFQTLFDYKFVFETDYRRRDWSRPAIWSFYLATDSCRVTLHLVIRWHLSGLS